jgi:hypothetical protein
MDNILDKHKVNALAKHNNTEDPVYKFCTENNIKLTWDFSKGDSCFWNEIMLGDKLIMQIEQKATLRQFLAIVKILHNDFNATIFPDDGGDFWFTPTKKDVFMEFCDVHYEALKLK